MMLSPLQIVVSFPKLTIGNSLTVILISSTPKQPNPSLTSTEYKPDLSTVIFCVDSLVFHL